MSGGFWVNIWDCHRVYGETSEDGDGPRFGGSPYDPRDPVERELFDIRFNGYIKKTTNPGQFMDKSDNSKTMLIYFGDF